MIERKDDEFGYKKILRGLLFVGGCIPFFIWIASQSYGDESDKHLSTLGWIGIAAFIVYTVLALVFIPRPEARYRCPKCRARLNMRLSDQTPNREYQFHCMAYDILWRTGVLEGDS